MSDPKIENLLELSLDVSEDTREKSENLSAGYDPEEKLWQVIIRYSGELLQLAGNYERVTPLLGGYAVLEVTEKQLRALAEEPQVKAKGVVFCRIRRKTGIVHSSRTEGAPFSDRTGYSGRNHRFRN